MGRQIPTLSGAARVRRFETPHDAGRYRTRFRTGPQRDAAPGLHAGDAGLSAPHPRNPQLRADAEGAAVLVQLRARERADRQGVAVSAGHQPDAGRGGEPAGTGRPRDRFRGTLSRPPSGECGHRRGQPPAGFLHGVGDGNSVPAVRRTPARDPGANAAGSDYAVYRSEPREAAGPRATRGREGLRDHRERDRVGGYFGGCAGYRSSWIGRGGNQYFRADNAVDRGEGRSRTGAACAGGGNFDF
ncbi:hypothetical protein G6F65_018120 [Rhizopus arrhizus]|nr:hypothetical protein G6F65_018120 [Rhizopus arrhizus]